MAQSRTERLVNLAIALQQSKRFLTFHEIRQMVSDYADQEEGEALDKTFDRDKEELRRLGFDIEVAAATAGSDMRDAYRISRDQSYLPALDLTAQQAVLLNLAATLWHDPSLDQGMSWALAKLDAVSRTELPTADPGLAETASTGDSTGEPASESAPGGNPPLAQSWALATGRAVDAQVMEPLLQGLEQAQLAKFGYHGRPRQLEPWRLATRAGAWYVLGYERQAAAPRLYKLSRIEGPVRLAGPPAAFSRPDDALIEQGLRQIEPPAPRETVFVALRADAGAALRRAARPVSPEQLADHRADQPGWITPPQGFAVWALGYARLDRVVSDICAEGPDALVLEPGPVRDGVIAQLRLVASWKEHHVQVG
ncbi:MAG: WYL domain-containing protein [Propionibacteriaceae bacterium]|nr:WYL domain-containing protein [Propionibacteriaceae bacterium]